MACGAGGGGIYRVVRSPASAALSMFRPSSYVAADGFSNDGAGQSAISRAFWVDGSILAPCIKKLSF